MARSITGMIGLAAALVFAVPVALLGVERLVGGELVWGLAFLGIAALMIIAEEYVMTPTDVGGSAVARAAGAVVKMPDEDAEDE